MEDQRIKQAIVMALDEQDESLDTENIAFFNSDGTPYTGFTGADGADGVDGLDMIAPLVTVSTAIGTAAKTTASAEPATGQLVAIKFTNGNSAETPTVAFNGGAARAIKLGGTAVVAAKLAIAADGLAFFYFDGTILHQLGVYS